MRAACKIVASAPPNVSRMGDRLQAIGFLERLPGPDNRREIALRLTTAGKRHPQRIRQQRESMLHQATNSMPSTERRALRTRRASDTAHRHRRGTRQTPCPLRSLNPLHWPTGQARRGSVK
ncbi:hypothetical protein ABZY19_37825 [Streptomyces sp. NPDC006475]|uniref:hypothetical protein n=1 Tax=Streptomyces sp. NPDC006475 TaxID=3155719 RepID=UPI0033BACFAE